MVSSSTPRGSVSCLLCKGSVSVRAGNLEKFRVHVESDHDVFYDHDILIAINFLEAHEKEVIIEKVLPRMRMIFNDVSYSNRKSIDDKLAIEKRLLEKDDEDEVLETLNHAPKKTKHTDEEKNNGSKIQRKEEINLEDSDEEDEKYNDKEEKDMQRASETLTENIQPTESILKTQPDSESEFSDCDVCHQSIRKSVFDFHRKSHLSSEAKINVECQHCGKVMQKTSMWRHMKSRCPTLLKMSKPISEETPDVPVMSEQTSKGSFQCKICFTDFQKLASLKLHTTEEHSLDLEDVEQMLSESSQDSGKETTHKTDTKASVKLDPEILEKMKATEFNEPGNDKFKCRYCDNVFTKKNNARRHEKRTHPEYVSSRHSIE